MTEQPTYKAKTLSGAQRRVRELLKQRDEANEVIGRLMHERIQLAKLAAKGPAFFNPLEAMEAEQIRDLVLARLNMNPDGTFKEPTDETA
jgi:hypothetical protein